MRRIAFWGTPELTTTYLDTLHTHEYTPVVVITNPDRPKGRGHTLTPTPAKKWAESHGIPVLTPEKCDDALYEALLSYELDLSIVIAYGSILPERFITLPKEGTWNVHYSLLPKYRGASPTEAAILAGDTETGVCIQSMRKALDSGPVLAHEQTPIGEDETTPELRSRLTELGAKLLIETLKKEVLIEVAQDESKATYCGKIEKEDGLLQIDGDPLTNYRKYRAYKERPRTFFFEDGKRYIITKAHLEDGHFVVDTVIPEGKKEQPYLRRK